MWTPGQPHQAVSSLARPPPTNGTLPFGGCLRRVSELRDGDTMCDLRPHAAPTAHSQHARPGSPAEGWWVVMGVHERGVAGGHLGGRTRNKGYARRTINDRPYDHTAQLTIREGRWARLTLYELDHDGHPMNTVMVQPIRSRAVGLVADSPVNWMVHCHNGYSSETGHGEPAGLHRVISARLRSGRGGRSRRWPL